MHAYYRSCFIHAQILTTNLTTRASSAQSLFKSFRLRINRRKRRSQNGLKRELIKLSLPPKTSKLDQATIKDGLAKQTKMICHDTKIPYTMMGLGIMISWQRPCCCCWLVIWYWYCLSWLCWGTVKKEGFEIIALLTKDENLSTWGWM